MRPVCTGTLLHYEQTVRHQMARPWSLGLKRSGTEKSTGAKMRVLCWAGPDCLLIVYRCTRAHPPVSAPRRTCCVERGRATRSLTTACSSCTGVYQFAYPCTPATSSSVAAHSLDLSMLLERFQARFQGQNSSIQTTTIHKQSNSQGIERPGQGGGCGKRVRVQRYTVGKQHGMECCGSG